MGQPFFRCNHYMFNWAKKIMIPKQPEIRPFVRAILESLENNRAEWRLSSIDPYMWNHKPSDIYLHNVHSPNHAVIKISGPETLDLTEYESKRVKEFFPTVPVPKDPQPGDKIISAIRPMELKRQLDLGLDPVRALEVAREMLK